MDTHITPIMKLNDEKVLYMLRGLPGAGKSTLAYALVGGYHEDCVFEADQYHYDEFGNYNWKAENLHTAHMDCQMRVQNAMLWNDTASNYFTRIVVSNTSTTESEMKFYLDLAKRFGYKVVSVIVENRHGNKSLHNVPDEALERMRQRFEVKL